MVLGQRVPPGNSQGQGSEYLCPLHCLCTQTACCVHNQNSGRNWSWYREWGMKGNMLGLIRAVPRRAMEERSQGSTKGIDIPPVEAPCWTKSLHTLCSHRAKPEQSQASSARAHLPLFVCITHACKWTIREQKYYWTGLHTGDTLWSSNTYWFMKIQHGSSLHCFLWPTLCMLLVLHLTYPKCACAK